MYQINFLLFRFESSAWGVGASPGCFAVARGLRRECWANILPIIDIMGAATVAESSLKATTTSLWNTLPTLPSLRLLDFDLSHYNKSFVNFAVLVGVFAVAKSTFSLAAAALQPRARLPSKKQLLDKYGHMAWALIADCKDNEQYVTFLAKNGFNLILMGQDSSVQRAKESALQIDAGLLIKAIVVDWKTAETDIKFYQGLIKDLEQVDVAFVILPRLQRNRENIPTHLEASQPFQHIYLLVRFFGAKLKFRSYYSAIVFPSHPNPEHISLHDGVSQGLIAGSDAFGRIISYELKGSVEIVVARGSVENAFAGMGIHKITH